MNAERNTKVVLAINGRYAILARVDKDKPWTQVEAIIGEDQAQKYADYLESDPDERAHVIDEYKEDEWFDDAPTKGVK